MLWGPSSEQKQNLQKLSEVNLIQGVPQLRRKPLRVLSNSPRISSFRFQSGLVFISSSTYSNHSWRQLREITVPYLQPPPSRPPPALLPHHTGVTSASRILLATTEQFSNRVAPLRVSKVITFTVAMLMIQTHKSNQVYHFYC